MILSILLGSHLSNIPVKSESHWPKVQEELAFKANYSQFSIFSSGGYLFIGAKSFYLFW